MATIVREGRQRWWEPLAANVLGGLWNDWQERERNKKANALYGEFARQVQELSGSQNDAGTLTQYGGQGLLNAPEPEGYNSDGWANAFHKAYTPLTQYDFGTGVTPNIAQGAANTLNGNAWAKTLGGANPLAQFDDGVAGLLGQAAPVQTNRIPTAQDTMNILANLLGSKRFGSVDPKAAYEMLTPYLKASEEARQEQRRQEAADAYMNAGNDKDKINQALRYAMQGYIPQETLGSAMDLYKYDNPLLQQYTHNTGATTRYGTFDARRGTFNQAGEFENELTPQQQLDHQFRMLQHDAQQAQQKAQMDYNYASLRQQGELERARLEQTGQTVQSIHTDANGKTWVVRQNGKREELSEAQGLTEQQKKMLELNAEQLKSIRSRREELEKSRRAWILKGYTENDQPVKEIDEALKGLNADEQQILQDSNDIVSPKNTGQQGQQGQVEQSAPANGSTATPLPPVAPPVARTISNAISYIGDNFSGIPKEAVLVNDEGHFYTQEDIDRIVAANNLDEAMYRENLKVAGYETPDEFMQSGGRFKVTDKTPRWRTKDGDVITYGQEKTLIAQVERGEHPGIKTKEELYQALRQKGATPIGVKQGIPAPQPISGDVPINVATNTDIQPNIQSGDISPNAIANINILGSSGDIVPNNNTANNQLIFDFFPSFGATPAYADENISGAADGNSEAEIQRAIDNLNGQFGEQRWEDWASGLGVRNTLNEINNDRQGITANPPYTDPNKLINILGVPLVYPNGDYNRYAAMGGRDLLNRDLRSPEEILRNITPMPNYTPNTNDLNIVPLADKRRARPQQVLSGRYSGDTRNGGQYANIINRQAKTHNVDPDLIAAIIQQESGGNSNAVSSVGAQGLMQLMPPTARGLGVTNSFDPEQNIAGGTKYIAQMLKRYNGDVEKALWAYNAGPGNADKGRLPAETKKYISSVMARYRRLKGIAAPSPKTPKKPVRRRRRTRNRRRR